MLLRPAVAWQCSQQRAHCQSMQLLLNPTPPPAPPPVQCALPHVTSRTHPIWVSRTRTWLRVQCVRCAASWCRRRRRTRVCSTRRGCAPSAPPAAARRPRPAKEFHTKIPPQGPLFFVFFSPPAQQSLEPTAGVRTSRRGITAARRKKEERRNAMHGAVWTVQGHPGGGGLCLQVRHHHHRPAGCSSPCTTCATEVTHPSSSCRAG